MSTAMMRMHRQITLSDQVEFLVLAESEPGPRKIKRRSIHDGKFHGVTVKPDASIDIGDMQGHVVKLSNTHTASTQF